MHENVLSGYHVNGHTLGFQSQILKLVQRCTNKINGTT